MPEEVRLDKKTSLIQAIARGQSIDAWAKKNQWPDSELEVRRFAISSFKLGQENRPFLLRSCFPHDLASVQCLTLAGWFSGGSVRQQILGGKQSGVCHVRVESED